MDQDTTAGSSVQHQIERVLRSSLTIEDLVRSWVRYILGDMISSVAEQ